VVLKKEFWLEYYVDYGYVKVGFLRGTRYSLSLEHDYSDYNELKDLFFFLLSPSSL